jgi:hypothetical protein
VVVSERTGKRLRGLRRPRKSCSLNGNLRRRLMSVSAGARVGSDGRVPDHRVMPLRWRVEHDYRELTTGLGIDHFEGRSYLGWHRHVTLAVLAQAFEPP